MPPSLPGAIAVLLLSSLIGDGVTDDFVNANLRKCMGYKSYARYGTTKAIWKKITAGTPAVIATRMALIASGPQPQTGVLAP